VVKLYCICFAVSRGRYLKLRDVATLSPDRDQRIATSWQHGMRDQGRDASRSLSPRVLPSRIASRKGIDPLTCETEKATRPIPVSLYTVYSDRSAWLVATDQRFLRLSDHTAFRPVILISTLIQMSERQDPQEGDAQSRPSLNDQASRQ
jgi:hypothetical protein